MPYMTTTEAQRTFKLGHHNADPILFIQAFAVYYRPSFKRNEV